MIKPTELRIGNWVLINGEPKQLNRKLFKHVVLDGLGLESLKPIPLTEELLLECGFVLLDKDYDSQVFNIYKLSNFTYNTSQNVFWFNNTYSFRQPKYLHQLQNLFFALTGEELTKK